MRNFIIAIVLLLGVIFLTTRFAEVESIVVTLQRGDWRFVLLAFFLILVWLLNMAGSFKTIFRVLGKKVALGRLLILTASAAFINVVAPSGGIGGIAVFITDSRQRGGTGARAMIAGAIYVIFDYLGFFLYLVWGLIILFQRNILQGAEVTASVIMFLLWVGMSILLYLALKSEQALADALAWLARTGNRLLKPFTKHEKFNELAARNIARDAAAGIDELRRRPLELIYPLLLGITNKLILLLIFFMMFLAFKVPVSMGTVVAGFSLAYLFVIVSPTPYGVGVVEGVLTLALRSMHVQVSDALVITMAYRGVTFWTPLLLGAIAFRWVGSPEKKVLEE